MSGSVPVVGVAGEDLLRPVELFEQHAAHQQVRPSHRPEREHRVGAVDDGGRRARRRRRSRTRRRRRRRRARPPGDRPVRCCSRPRRARRARPAARPCGSAARISSASRAFSSAAGRAPFFLDLDDRRRRHDAPGIERLQLVERPAAQPADREDDEGGSAGPIAARRRDAAPAVGNRPAGRRPTSFRDCSRRGFPAGKDARSHRRHRSAPSRPAPCPRPARGRGKACSRWSVSATTCRAERPVATTM